MHPFGDGNGRIHRFLIHNILARHGFTPEGIIFPISAAMLNNMDAYDAALESYSKPLIPLVDYTLDEEGRMEVHNQTAIHYRYPDMTVITEALFDFIQSTIEKELVDELNFLQNYDITKTAVQEIVDMPDQRIDLFIRFCLQNHGVLSQRKRNSHFSELTEDEVQRMQAAVQKAYH
jgi:Fic family protein